MKANCWMGTRNVQVTDVPDPAILNPRDAIVRITNTAICGSDLHLYNGFIPSMKRGDVLMIDPCIPTAWHDFSIEYRHGASTYRIAVENPDGVAEGVVSVEIDGRPAPDRAIPLVDDGAEHVVVVVLGAEA